MVSQTLSRPTLATIVHDQSLFSTIIVVCDIRLGILLAGELGLLTSEAPAYSTVVLLFGAGMSWIPMWLIHKSPKLPNEQLAVPLCRSRRYRHDYHRSSEFL